MIHYQDDRVVLHRGDCREVLRVLPEASVHCVVTSPPYWGLRDYGLDPLVWNGDEACAHEWGPPVRVHKGGPTGPNSALEGRQANPERDATKDLDAGAFCARCGAWRGALGLEPTPDLYVEHLVGIFREIRRVLRPDGVVWLNLGDCYATGAGKVGEHPGGGAQGARWAGRRAGDQLAEDGSDRSDTWRDRLAGRGRHDAGNSGKAASRLEAMGPMTQPNRLPLPGLKPKDLVGIPWRVAFALQADGWWLRADVVWAKGASFLEGWAGSIMPESVTDRPTRAHEYLFLLAKSERYYYNADAIREPSLTAAERRWDPGTDGHQGGLSHAGSGTSTRRFRQPWPSGWCDHENCDGRHLFGRYRRKTADNPHAGGRRQASEPGEPNAFHPLGRNVRSVWAISPEPFPEAHFATFPERLVKPCIVAGCPAGGVVLDPFAGACTTLLVAKELGRRAVGVELKAEYCLIGDRRLRQEVLAL